MNMCMICYENIDKIVKCEICNSKLCGNCVVDFIDHIDDHQIENVIFTRKKRTFECPNIDCKGGIFNFDNFISLNILNIDQYLSMMGLVSEKISKKKEFIAIDNYKKYGDVNQFLQDLPQDERLFREWCDRFTIFTPCCNRAFILRDGCMSIKCECGKSFCGLCLNFVAVDKDSNGPCHNHVKQCPNNTLFRGEFFTPEWYMMFNHIFRIANQLQEFINSLIIEERFDLLFDFCKKLRPELNQYQIKLCANGVVRIKLSEEQKPYFRSPKEENNINNTEVINTEGPLRTEEPLGLFEPLRITPIKKKRKCSLCKSKSYNYSEIFLSNLNKTNYY